LKDKALLNKILIFIIAIGVLLLGIFLYAYINYKFGWGFPCTLYETFGIYCAGCGLTRAAVSFLQLDFYQAFRYNALSIIILPLIFFVSLSFIWETVFEKQSFIQKIPLPFWIIFAVCLFIYGVIRNFIPWLQPVVL